MNNLPTLTGASRVPAETTSHTTAPSTNYAYTSVTNSLGLRRHTLTTGSRALYHAFYAQVLDVDDQPDFVAFEGTFSIQFYADDTQCQAVIEAALRATVQEGGA